MHKLTKNVLIASLLLMLIVNIRLEAQILTIPSPPVIGAKSYLVIDATTDFEIAALDPDLKLPPASITKLMTAYVVFQALKSDQIMLSDEITVSEKAWRAEGSRMFIEVGKKVSVDDLLMGMIVQSGNDASIALAEHIAGNEDLFADIMNQYAYKLNMTNSNFMNASGLPDENHYSTANDLAILAKAIIKEFPEFYKLYSTKEFTFNNKIIRIAAIAKGSGMIAPNLATMLSFIFTDADIPSNLLKTLLKKAVANTFNAITVDSDQSTNDMVSIFSTRKIKIGV